MYRHSWPHDDHADHKSPSAVLDCLATCAGRLCTVRCYGMSGLRVSVCQASCVLYILLPHLAIVPAGCHHYILPMQCTVWRTAPFLGPALTCLSGSIGQRRLLDSICQHSCSFMEEASLLEVWVFLCPAHALTLEPRKHQSFPIAAKDQLCVCSGLDSHDSICRAIASRTPCVVVSVEYR